jgi:hypothetical protein
LENSLDEKFGEKWPFWLKMQQRMGGGDNRNFGLESPILAEN